MILVGFGLSLFAYLLLCLVVNAFIVTYPFTLLTDNQTIYWIYFDLLGHVSFWLTLLLSVCAALVPDVVFQVIGNLRNAMKIMLKKQEDAQRAREKQAEHLQSQQDGDGGGSGGDGEANGGGDVASGGFENMHDPNVMPNYVKSKSLLKSRKNKIKVFVIPSEEANQMQNTRRLEERLSGSPDAAAAAAAALNGTERSRSTGRRTNSDNFKVEVIK